MLFVIITTLSLQVLTFSTALHCYSCDGADCTEGSCEGDYCIISRFAAKWGQSYAGQERSLKGCSSGDLLQKDIPKHCEASDMVNNPDDIINCYCNNEDYCNIDVQGIIDQTLPLITCICENSDTCGGSQVCMGQICTFQENVRTGEVAKGCWNESAPLVSRTSLSGCTRPPLLGGIEYHHSTFEAEDLLNLEVCYCSTPFCNLNKPTELKPRDSKCPVSVETDLGAGLQRGGDDSLTCQGQLCKTIELNNTRRGEMLKRVRIQGCMTDRTEVIPSEELLLGEGCLRVDSETLQIEACFEDKKPLVKKVVDQLNQFNVVRKVTVGDPDDTGIGGAVIGVVILLSMLVFVVVIVRSGVCTKCKRAQYDSVAG